MSIKSFYKKYSNEQYETIDRIYDRWREKEVDSILDALTFSSVIGVNSLQGDGITNRIPPDLFEALRSDSYGEARALLRGYLEKPDSSIQGFVSRVKGQIGENQFVKATGDKARLASSPNQEGWDVAIDHPNYTQFVQVKTYESPHKVVDHIERVNKKLEQAQILDEDNNPIEKIDFAIPRNITDEVTRIMKEKDITGVTIIPMNITAKEAGDIVHTGLGNLSDEAVPHFFNELLIGVATPTAIIAAVNAFQVYRGAKEAPDAIYDMTESAALSAAGFAVGYGVEVTLDTVLDAMLGPAGATAGVATRIMLKKIISSRKELYSQIVTYKNQLNSEIYRFS